MPETKRPPIVRAASVAGLRYALDAGRFKLRFLVGPREHDFAIGHIDVDHAGKLELARQDAIGEHVLDLVLDQAAQRASAVVGIVALLGQPLARFLADLKRDRVLDQALAYLVELQIDNLLDFRAAERTEDDGRIDAVDKLGAEGTAQLLHDVLPHFLVVALLVGFRLRCWNAEAERAAAFDGIRADVARHDDDRVAEVHAATARIRQLALFHDLKQHVKGFRVGLFDFVEDDNAVRTATNGLGQLTGVLITDIAGRRTDQTSDRVPLHELAHVKLDERVFAAK